jgi:hypothetical protein
LHHGERVVGHEQCAPLRPPSPPSCPQGAGVRAWQHLKRDASPRSACRQIEAPQRRLVRGSHGHLRHGSAGISAGSVCLTYIIAAAAAASAQPPSNGVHIGVSDLGMMLECAAAALPARVNLPGGGKRRDLRRGRVGAHVFTLMHFFPRSLLGLARVLLSLSCTSLGYIQNLFYFPLAKSNR